MNQHLLNNLLLGLPAMVAFQRWIHMSTK